MSTSTSTFLVRFIQIGPARVSWETRVARPVTDERLTFELQRHCRKHKGILASRGIACVEMGDYGGVVLAGDREVGRYLIVPGSEEEVRQGPRS